MSIADSILGAATVLSLAHVISWWIRLEADEENRQRARLDAAEQQEKYFAAQTRLVDSWHGKQTNPETRGGK